MENWNPKELAERTQDAYMADSYGKSWTACARLLKRMGFTEDEAEWVLRSKHMRWADDAQGRGDGKRTNSAAFARYVDKVYEQGGLLLW